MSAADRVLADKKLKLSELNTEPALRLETKWVGQ